MLNTTFLSPTKAPNIRIHVGGCLFKPQALKVCDTIFLLVVKITADTSDSVK